MALRLGFNANSARNMAEIPNIVAQRKGFFAREGLAVTMVPLMGTTHMVAALDSGDVDATGTASPYMIEAALKGSDAVAVIGGVANTIYSLIAKAGHPRHRRPERQARRASRRRPIRSRCRRGCCSPRAVSKTAIIAPRRSSAAASGLNVWPAGRAMPYRSASPKTSSFMRKGFRKLGDSLEVLPNLQFNVIAVRRSWAAAHKAIVVALARAFGDTFRYLRDPAERADVLKTVVEHTGTNEEVARAVLALYFEPDRGVMPKQAEINMAGLAKVIALLGPPARSASRFRNRGRFVDLQYLQAAGLQ